MSKYHLCYEEQDTVKIINLYSLVSILNLNIEKNIGKNNQADLKDIDMITSKFNSMNELLIFLKNNNLVPKNISSIFITKTDLNLIPNYIVYKKNYECLNEGYITSRKKDYEYIYSVSKYYYDDTIYKLNNLKSYDETSYRKYLMSTKNILDVIKANCRNAKNGDFDNKDYDENIEELKRIIFYDHNKFSYRKAHVFALTNISFNHNMLKEFDGYKEYNYDNNNYDDEETITKEEMEIINLRNMKKFVEENRELIDGNDYYKSFSKEEYDEFLKESARRLH